MKMKNYTVVICLALLYAVELFSFSLNGRFIGENLNITKNAYIISKNMYFVDGQDTIVARLMLMPVGDDYVDAKKHDDQLKYFDTGIYVNSFLTEDSVYTFVLQPVTKAQLSETSEDEAFYYKNNCIFPDSADNLFYEIRTDTVSPSSHQSSLNMYIDIDKRLYKIKKLLPSTGGDHNMLRYVYFEIPRADITYVLDSLYSDSAK